MEIDHYSRGTNSPQFLHLVMVSDPLSFIDFIDRLNTFATEQGYMHLGCWRGYVDDMPILESKGNIHFED